MPTNQPKEVPLKELITLRNSAQLALEVLDSRIAKLSQAEDARRVTDLSVAIHPILTNPHLPAVPLSH